MYNSDSILVRHLQLLQDDRCLLVIGYTHEVLIYLEKIDSIENAVHNSRFKKRLHKEKIGNDFLLAFDESKRMLAVCATDKVIFPPTKWYIST